MPPPPPRNTGKGKNVDNSEDAPPKPAKNSQKDAAKEKMKGTVGTSGYTKIKCRHILCEKHGKALEALTKILAGASFADTAKAYSNDKARSGGDLGWKLRGELDPTFADAAFALQIGGMSEAPVKTPFGYHLILCEDKA